MTDTRQRYVRLEPQPTADSRGDESQSESPGPMPANAFQALAAASGDANQSKQTSMHHDGSFKSYMGLKVTKLREQYESNSFHVAPASDLFKGISIFVNGYTRPSGQELKQLMLLHGGRFENYLYPSAVTHIICNNLPDTKIKQLAHERNPLPIVRPDWILASLEAKRILPIKDFQLLPLSDAPGQRKLMDFKHYQAPLPAPEHMYQQLQQQEQEQGCSSSGWQQLGVDQHTAEQAHDAWQQQQQDEVQEVEEAVAEQLHQSRATAACGHQQQQQMEVEVAEQAVHHQGLLYPPQQQVPLHPRAQGQAMPVAQPGLRSPISAAGDPGYPSRVLLPPSLPPHNTAAHSLHTHNTAAHNTAAHNTGAHSTGAHYQQQGTTAAPGDGGSGVRDSSKGGGAGIAAQGEGDEMRAAQELCAQLRAACDVLRGAPKSSWDNPNFMDDFFRSSRLHFIGTWKSRIEALMAERGDAGPQPRQVQAARPIVDMFQSRAGASTSSSAAAAGPSERVIVHIDMDCFFASVAVAAHPLLRGKPLVVSHSASAQGRGEVSAANYEARAFGICAEMAIGEAKRLCPHLLVVPYMFVKYQEVSEKVYHILLRYSTCVQPLSCDEAYLDVTGLGDPEALVAALRQDILLETGCTASAGLGPNMLVARLATRKAKPNGQHRVRSEQVMQFMSDLSVEALPGVGWALKNKLKDLGISLVRQVWSVSKEQLQRQLGTKTGQALWGYAHGRDERQVEPPKTRKSVGAEVNWGIRFAGWDDVTHFLGELSNEVVQRLKAAGVQGKGITLKLKRKQAGAPAPWKLLGHGPCDNLSRSVTLGSFTDSADVIFKESMTLITALAVPPEDMRGVGIAISKLNTDVAAIAARPAAPAPAKMPAPAPRVYNKSALNPWPALAELTAEQAEAGIRSPQLRPANTTPSRPAAPVTAPPPAQPPQEQTMAGPTTAGPQQHGLFKAQKQLQFGGAGSVIDTGTGVCTRDTRDAVSGEAEQGLGAALAALHAAAARGAGGESGNQGAAAHHGLLVGQALSSPLHSSGSMNDQEQDAAVGGGSDMDMVMLGAAEGGEVLGNGLQGGGAGGVAVVGDAGGVPARPAASKRSAGDVQNGSTTFEGDRAAKRGRGGDAGPAQGSIRQPRGSREGVSRAAHAQLPPIDSLDPEVLAALPDEVRQELRAVYGHAITELVPTSAAPSTSHALSNTTATTTTSRRPTAAASREAGRRVNTGRRGGGGGGQGSGRTAKPAGSTHTTTSGGGSRDAAGPPPRLQTHFNSSGKISVGDLAQPLIPSSHHHNVFTRDGAAATRDGTAAAVSGRAAGGTAGSHAGHMDITASQLDPTVLAELPEDIRREVLRTVAVHHKRGAGSSHAARESGPAGGEQQQRSHALPPLPPGPSRTVESGAGGLHEGRVQEEENGGVYAQEAPGVVLRSFKRMVDRLMTAGAVQVDGRQQQQVALPDGDSGRQQGIDGRAEAVAALQDAAAPGCVPAALAQQQLHERLMLACEHLMQWVLSRGWDLETHGHVLAVLRQLCHKWPAVSQYLACCVDIVQQQADKNYGLTLEPACLC